MLLQLNLLYTTYGFNQFATARLPHATLAVAVFLGILARPRIVNGSHLYTKFTRINLHSKLATLNL